MLEYFRDENALWPLYLFKDGGGTYISAQFGYRPYFEHLELAQDFSNSNDGFGQFDFVRDGLAIILIFLIENPFQRRIYVVKSVLI